MSAPKSAPEMTDWQQYWDNWFQQQRSFLDQQMKDMPGAQNKWSEFFKEWQNTVGGNAPGAGTFPAFFQQAGKQYLDMLQYFQQATGQEKSVNDTTGEWLKNLQQHFLGMLQMNTAPTSAAESYRTMYDAMARSGSAFMSAFQPGNPFFQGPQGFGAYNNFSPAFGNGFGQNFAPTFGMSFNPMSGFTPGGLNGGFNGGFNGAGFNTGAWNQAQPQWNPEAAFQSMDPFGFYASLPGIGYTREKQEELNKLYKSWTLFETEVRKYNAAMAQVGLEAIYKFQEYINNPPANDAGLKSLKEVYAKWVDVCEDVYAKYAMSEEYTRLYGEVVNALMAFKSQLGTITDQTVEQLNLPTRKEVDSLHERMHALRRENAELRKIVDEIRGVKTKRPAPKAKSAKKGGRT